MISLIAVLNNRALDFKVPKNKADLVLSMFQNGVEQWGPLPHVSGRSYLTILSTSKVLLARFFLLAKEGT